MATDWPEHPRHRVHAPGLGCGCAMCAQPRPVVTMTPQQAQERRVAYAISRGGLNPPHRSRVDSVPPRRGV